MGRAGAGTGSRRGAAKRLGSAHKVARHESKSLSDAKVTRGINAEFGGQRTRRSDFDC